MNQKELEQRAKDMRNAMLKAGNMAKRIREKTEFQDLTLTSTKENKYYFTAELGGEEIQLRAVDNRENKHLEMKTENGWNHIRWI